MYDLDPAVLGRFDVVHVADLLLHLRSPIAALAAVRSVTDGEAIITDVFHPGVSGPSRQVVEYRGGWGDLVWWMPSLDALAQMVLDAGFRDVEVVRVYNLARRVDTFGLWRAALRATV